MEKRQKELVKKLQAEARMLFYDHMMYDINDSLTSILAVCEIEPKEAIPKIKQYIHRINQSLHDTKNYQNNSYDEKKFNISLVVKNIIRAIEGNYRQMKLIPLVSDIKAPVLGEQSKFEQLILCILVGILFELNANDSEVLIELRQKDQDALLTILKDNFAFSKEILEQINTMSQTEDFKGSVQITPQGKGVEVIIKIPLQFQMVNIGKPILKKTTSPKQSAPRKIKIPAPNKEGVPAILEEEGVTVPGIAF